MMVVYAKLEFMHILNKEKFKSFKCSAMEEACGCFYVTLTALCYQPSRALKKFFALKVLQVVALTLSVTFIYSQRRLILYRRDVLGSLTDNYKFWVSVTMSFVIILEPLVKFRYYGNHENLGKQFLDSLKSFRHQVDVTSVYRKMRQRLVVGVACFALFYCFCELGWILCFLDTFQSRMFYLTFLPPTFIIQLKTLQHVMYLMFIETQLRILKCLVKEVNQEASHNQSLKSKAYDRIIRNKLNKIRSMYDNVTEMVENFNSSLGLTQLFMAVCVKLFLIGDFYWVALIFLHFKTEPLATYGRRG